MAIGDRTPKKLGQSALNTTAVSVVTNQSASYRVQVTQLFITNTNTTTQRTVTLYAHGTATSNTLSQEIVLPAKASVIIDTKIVLIGTETVSAKQDTGTDVIITAYGIEEQIA